MADTTEAWEAGTLVTIGYVRFALKDRDTAPRQGRDGAGEAWIEVLEPFADGLLGLEDRGRVQVICWLHLAPRDGLRVRPRGDPTVPPAGVFATRSPARPNAQGFRRPEALAAKGAFAKLRALPSYRELLASSRSLSP